jgi:hypothetical protein
MLKEQLLDIPKPVEPPPANLELLRLDSMSKKQLISLRAKNIAQRMTESS